MARAPFLDSIVTFLRTGYPNGVPDVDYIPLFALLRRQLSADEVAAVAEELVASGDPASAASIADAIRTTIHDKPLESDIARVSAHLAAGGWPLASPHNGTRSR